MKALYKCRDGYTLRGANTTECNFGNWTGEPPHCQQGMYKHIDCSFLKKPLKESLHNFVNKLIN